MSEFREEDRPLTEEAFVDFSKATAFVFLLLIISLMCFVGAGCLALVDQDKYPSVIQDGPRVIRAMGLIGFVSWGWAVWIILTKKRKR